MNSIGRKALSAVAAMALWLMVGHPLHAQIQYTTTCPSGQWDILSISVLDPGLSANYHMQGTLMNGDTAYTFTTWNQAQNKVSYVKNPQGWPWDINLYDSNYIYQWITEYDWTTAYAYKKFNNGLQNSTSDFSFRWAPRCGVPGQWSVWSPGPTSPPTAQYSSRYEENPPTCGPATAKGLSNTLLELKPSANITISDTRRSPAVAINAIDLPIQYSWDCTTLGDTKTCHTREVFDYAVDSTANPVDNLIHSYGWVYWRQYTNDAAPTGESWRLVNWSDSRNLVANKSGVDGAPIFPCF